MRMILRSMLVLLCTLAGRVLAAETPATFKVGEFNFTRPKAWEWVDVAGSPMRKAQLKVSGEDKAQSAEVVFFYFGEGGAGGARANVDRWLGQFQEPKDKLNSKVEDVTINKHKVTFVQAEGTYLSGMPGAAQRTAQPNSMLLGAILESEQGNVFIKLTGPAKLVKASQQPFNQMVRSALQ